MTREEYEYKRALAKARYDESMYQRRASGYPKNYDLGGDGGPRRSSKGLIPLKNKGVMSDLGSIGKFVSDDNNDLDNLSFSTTEGLNATFKNNRVKDSVPKYKVGDGSMQPVFPNFEGVTSDDLADPNKVINFKPSSTALTSFIDENSAGPKGEYAGDKGIDIGYAGDRGIDLGYAEDSGISLDDSINLNQQNINQEEIPLDQLVSEYDGALLEDQVTGNGRFDGVTSDDLATTLSSQEPLLDGSYAGDKGIDLGYAGDRGIDLGYAGDSGISLTEDFQLPENYEALDQVVTEFELANPELVKQHRNELEAEKLAEEKEYIENFALENPDLAEHLLENPELVSELEDGEALYDGLVKLNDENSPAGQFEGVTSDDLALEQGLDQGLEQEVLKEEKDNREAYIQLSNSMSSEDLAALEGEVSDIASQTDVDGQEGTEAKLADLFGSLKDIFGVDNKSLLRAAIKYIGGRVFGLSSGKAAQFAWAGIEADMATNAAKGADARAYQDNMDEYDKMYEAAMGREDFDEANRILQKMNSLSGVEKSDAEKFDDNLSYLNKKYNEAKKAKDTRKMSQIDKQLKLLESQGFDGTTSDPWYGNISMEDSNGAKLVKEGKQTPGGLMFLDDKDGKWKFPRDEGYTNTKRTVKSDDNEVRFATDTRTNIPADELGRYQTDIIGATSVTAGGDPNFDEKSANQKNANFSKTAVNAYMHMEDMLMHSPEARLQIFALEQAFRNEIGNAESGPIQGVVKKFLKRDMTPIAKMWYNNMNTLITSKLRVETGAAYNKEELLNTLSFFPNTADYPSREKYEKMSQEEQDKAFDLVKSRMFTARNWMLENAGGLKSKGYLEGLINETYRPTDNWLEVQKINKNLMDFYFKPEVSDDLANSDLLPK